MTTTAVARQTVRDVLELIAADEGPPVVVLTGPVGSGRSTELAALGRALRGLGRRVTEVRVTDDGVPVATRLDGAGARNEPLPVGPVAGAREDRSVARNAAAAMTAPVLGRDGIALVDDSQWMDPDTLAVLEAVADRISGTPVRYVCAVATPGTGPSYAEATSVLRRLRAAGLVTTVRVPPLDGEEIARLAHAHLGAVPAPELVDRIRARTRGIAAAVTDALDSMQRVSGVRVVSGHAYLALDAPDDLSGGIAASLQAGVQRMGPQVWDAARTVAALQPAGPALTDLLAMALQTDRDGALARLDELHRAGILHPTRDGSWRFVVPLLGDGLRAGLGPYARRIMAALVVQAVWANRASLDPPEIADRIAVAGRLLPPERAHDELVAAAERAIPGVAPRRDLRWWAAAAELAGTRTQQVHARVERTRAHERAGDTADAVAGARELLDDESPLPVDVRHGLFLTVVLGLHTLRDTAGLDAVSEGSALWNGDESIRAICRVLAYALRGRWRSAYSLLDRTRAEWTTEPDTREIGAMIEQVGDLFAGRTHAALDPARADTRSVQEPGRRRYRGHWAVASRVALGDVEGGRAAAQAAGLAEAELLPQHRAVFALLEGRPEAPELARRATADPGSRMFEIGRAMFHQLFAGLLLVRGQLTGARTLIAEARDEMPALDHVLDVPEAALDTTLGDRDTARARLEGALDRARDNDLMVGTELLLSMLVEADVTDGDTTGAQARSRELDEVAAALGTPRALMHAAFGRAVAHTDTGSALDCLRTAERHGQHFEKAHLGLRLAWSGLVDPTTLHDVYDYFGRVDAPLARSWTRSAMETRGVPVPGRSVTKAENERLLGQLLTEGLTNRQIATVLDRSEKSVEGRLGRLFARTGYRSRIELAAALLDGTYPH